MTLKSRHLSISLILSSLPYFIYLLVRKLRKKFPVKPILSPATPAPTPWICNANRNQKIGQKSSSKS